MSEVKTYAVNCNDAWLNTKGDDISDSYVKYADYAELAVHLANAESKCRELASENAALKEVVSGVNSELYGQGFEVSGWHLNGALEPLDNWFTDNGWGMPETPATDAFMAEVRAHGVEMAMEHMQSSGSLTFGDCYISLNEFAAQLRKGSAL